MTGRNVIMGFATHLPAEHFVPFVQSARHACFDGRICIFTAQMTERDKSELARAGCEVLDVEPLHPPVASDALVSALRRLKHTRGLRKHYPRIYALAMRLFRYRPGSAALRDAEFRLQGAQALRYEHYHRFLEANPDIEQVLISDVRDVVFQASPFDPPIDGLEVFLEPPHMLMRRPGFNSTWYTTLYGDVELARFGNRIVSCSGVTAGTRAAMMAYTAAMIEAVAGMQLPLGPHDQAIHNRLLHLDAVPHRAFQNGTGRVLTMGEMKRLDFDDEGFVVQADGRRPPVLHQYDRHVALVPAIRTRVGCDIDLRDRPVVAPTDEQPPVGTT
jgi:hypothetical protein